MGDKAVNRQASALGEHLLSSYEEGDLVSWKRTLSSPRIYGVILRVYTDKPPSVNRNMAYAKVVDASGSIDVQLLSSLRKET